MSSPPTVPPAPRPRPRGRRRRPAGPGRPSPRARRSRRRGAGRPPRGARPRPRWSAGTTGRPRRAGPACRFRRAPDDQAAVEAPELRPPLGRDPGGRRPVEAVVDQVEPGAAWAAANSGSRRQCETPAIGARSPSLRSASARSFQWRRLERLPEPPARRRLRALLRRASAGLGA